MEFCQTFVCRNLSEAKAYVHGAGIYQDRGQYPFPNAVVCDYQLGGESGIEFVAWLKSTADFKNLPVIILSGSQSPEDLAAASKSGAIDVLVKPVRFEELKMMLTDLARKLCD